MVLLLYAVVPADDRTGDPEGLLTGHALRRLDGPTVGVLYEERDRGPDRAELLPFGEAVQALSSAGPVLPVRFGTVLTDLTELNDLVEQRAPQWEERLDAVRGHVELVVHAQQPAAPTPPPSDGSGTAYLLSRAAALRQEEEMQSSLLDAIRPVASEIRVLRGNREVRVACLVSADRVAPLRAAVRRWAEACEGRLAEATGPWPAFSFTEAGDPR
jgi:hypothetical protein